MAALTMSAARAQAPAVSVRAHAPSTRARGVSAAVSSFASQTGSICVRSAFTGRALQAARAPAASAPASVRAARLAVSAGEWPQLTVPEERVGEKNSLDGKDPKDVTVAVFGATGYIGKFVTKEMVARGYNVIAFAREKSGIGGAKSKADTQKELEGADVRFGEVTENGAAIRSKITENVDVVVSCLASRTGGVKDSNVIDYEATANCLEFGKMAGAKHFVLLSAICAQKPLLEFQRTKLRFEEELMSTEGITFSVVRPTAFFKSLGGQVASCKGGGPYVMFGDGQLAACKPISERDLAKYMADCVQSSDLCNKMLPIGGPGKAMTALEQGTMLFRLLGKEEKFIRVPIQIMDGLIAILDVLAGLFPNLTDAAEFGKIGRYYAAESMLVWDDEKGAYDADATPSYGEDTLEQFFQKCIDEGMAGQELGDQAVF